MLMPAWQKGNVANAQGIASSAYHVARKVCAEHTPEAIQRQIQLMRESDDDRVVMIAAQAIIDRGAGKIRDHSAEKEGGKIDLSALSADERNAMVELLKKAMGLE